MAKLRKCRFFKDAKCKHRAWEGGLGQIPPREDCVCCLLANVLARLGHHCDEGFLVSED